jgi:hypothetical protein
LLHRQLTQAQQSILRLLKGIALNGTSLAL